QTEWLAYAIASGCMGGNHLYEDMGLPNRQALSDLLNRHFTALFVKNAGNMKWKKFFYKQLCDRARVSTCKAPSCQACADLDACFGPEDDTGLAVLARLGQDVGC
ncbi:MAG TPA: nitrogen fixation protein NifQ, partial [Telluria sp.]